MFDHDGIRGRAILCSSLLCSCGNSMRFAFISVVHLQINHIGYLHDEKVGTKSFNLSTYLFSLVVFAMRT